MPQMVDVVILEVRKAGEVHVSAVVAKQGFVERQVSIDPMSANSAKCKARRKMFATSSVGESELKSHGNMKTTGSSSLRSTWCYA